jgi:hypothetical protein
LLFVTCKQKAGELAGERACQHICKKQMLAGELAQVRISLFFPSRFFFINKKAHMWAGDGAGASEHFAAERAPDAAATQGDFAHDAA